MSSRNSSQFVHAYSKAWKEAGWISDDEQQVFNLYGYYSKKHLTLKDGRVYNSTRVIFINTMSCYYYNFLITKTRFDPGD
jgi:hypothetical protein